MIRTPVLLCSAFALAHSLAFAASPAIDSPEKFSLGGDWQIQSSAAVKASGPELSQADYQASNWYAAHVPTTVVAALVADKLYTDPNFGKNLRDISGTTYPIGGNFSNIQMPPESPFKAPWWYRTTFSAPAEWRGRRLQLHFDGINFRANIWLNGHQLATADQVAGSWRLFEFNITDSLQWDKPNALAVEVFPPTPHDLAITFVDWNPAPPDKGMGIWRPVYITASGPVALRNPQVITKLELPTANRAHLTVTAELKNVTDQLVAGLLKGDIEGHTFSRKVKLDAHQTVVVRFDPDQFASLVIEKPRLWWPYEWGRQNFYRLKLRFEAAGDLSDQLTTRFGIREVTSELVSQPPGVEPSVARLFKINGRKILVRGAGYSFDMLLRESPESDREHLQYVRDMHLNTVRLEGKIATDNFLDLADEYGILVTAGWCCCDHWERWRDWDAEDHRIAAGSLRDQIRRLRNHPSVFNWMNGSDFPPPPDVEKMYTGILKETDWPNPYESSATARSTSVTGATGVKMSGPYEFVPPAYWLLEKGTLGGAHGFNTETSPGAAVPPIDTLREMLPEDHLWPVDSWWDYHAGGGAFHNIDKFRKALDQRYGPSHSVAEFSEKSQAAAYEGERAMFEAYGRNKYVSTGIIQWMLNNAWPSIIWHLYDYSMRPGGGYFGTKKACEPLHVQYSYDDGSVFVVNSLYESFKDLKVSVQLLDLQLNEKFSQTSTITVGPDASQRVLTVGIPQDISGTYFLKLTLTDITGKQVSANFYWLSTKPDVLDFGNSTWYYTPEKTYADLTGLNALPQVRLNLSAQREQRVEQGRAKVMVTVENPSRDLAFLVHLKLMRFFRDPEEDDAHASSEVLPILWQDNYFPLLPGEKREVEAEYAADKDTPPSVVAIDGWNVEPLSTALPETTAQ